MYAMYRYQGIHTILQCAFAADVYKCVLSMQVPTTTAGYCMMSYKNNIMSRDRVCAWNPLGRFATIDALFDYFYYYHFQTSFRRVRWRKRQITRCGGTSRALHMRVYRQIRSINMRRVHGHQRRALCRRRRSASAQRFRGDVVSCRRLSRESPHTLP